MSKELSDDDNLDNIRLKKMDKWLHKKLKISETYPFMVELLKIRTKSLRRLCLLSYNFYYYSYIQSMNFSNDKLSIITNVEQIMECLECDRRTAYDYFRTLMILSRIEELNNDAFYKYMKLGTELEKQANQEVKNES